MCENFHNSICMNKTEILGYTADLNLTEIGGKSLLFIEHDDFCKAVIRQTTFPG